jgi:hypothetical protein
MCDHTGYCVWHIEICILPGDWQQVCVLYGISKCKAEQGFDLVIAARSKIK